MIGPATDSIEPRLEQPEFRITQSIHELFQQEDAEDFLFQDTPAK